MEREPTTGETPPAAVEPGNGVGHGAPPAGERGAGAAARRSRFGAPGGFYFYGVVRSRGWRPAARGGEREELVRVQYRDLEALVRPVPFELPVLDEVHVQAHQRTVETAMRRGTVLPAPYGIIFRGRRAVIRFLEDQYLALDEGLAFIDGHWELRLHIAGANAADAGPDLVDIALHCYAELRRFARAAVPFRQEAPRIISAAFLVQRASWIDFVNRADDLGATHPELSFDVTGPWPAYDFVRMTL